MNKMVDMQKAFDAVYKYFHLGNAMECERLYKALEEAYELTAQSERWIPCSERSPEEADGIVLVCMPDEPPYNRREPFINAKHNQQVEVAMYSQHSDTWFFGMGAVSSTKPIVWMPLPEPYKRSKDTDEIN